MSVQLNCLLSNCRSLASLAKISSLFAQLRFDSIDIAFFCETFLNSSFPDSCFNDVDYNFLRFDRIPNGIKSHGGGVLVLYKHAIGIAAVDIKAQEHYHSHGCEILAFDIVHKIKSMKCRVFLVYRPPSTSFIETSNLCKHIKSYLLPLNNIVLGDLNCPKTNWAQCLPPKDRSELPLFNLSKLFNMKQMVDFPTRISSRGTSNILDVILTDSIDLIPLCTPYPPIFNSDHKTVRFSLTSPQQPFESPNVPSLNYRKANFEAILNFLSSFNWDNQFSYFSSVQSKYDHFCRLFKESFELFTPVFDPTKAKVPYKLRYLLNQRKLVRNDNRAYRHIQSQIRTFCRKSKANHENSLLERGCAKSFFQYINGKLKAQQSIPPLLDSSGNLAFSNLDKANLLVSTFSENYSISSPNVNIDMAVFPLPKRQSCPIDFSPYNVLKYLNKLPNKTGFSAEGINQFMLKKCASVLALPLSYLFYEFYQTGILPEQWKISYIVPIFKKGTKTDPANYRPISLTSTICRLMEKIIVDSIRVSYSMSFDSLQFGFLKQRSCTLSLLNSMSTWQQLLKKKLPVDAVYFDMKSAFDKVVHKKLFLKMKLFGIDEKIIRFYENFLSNRYSYVRINGINSTCPIRVSSGVPQGTVSGPLLFLIYINDISMIIPPEVNYSIFADDLKIFGSSSESLQKAINNVMQWSLTWELPLAPKKITVLHLGSNNPNHIYKLGNDCIAWSSPVKDLGVYIDDKLNFEYHISEKVLRATILCKQILRCFHFDKPKPFFDLYNCYVRPILEYCSEIYSPYSNSRLCSELEKPLRMFSMHVFKRFGMPYSSYNDRLVQSHILSQFQRRILCDLTLCFKLLTQKAHCPNMPLRLSNSNRHSFRIISNANIFRFDNFYFARICKMWNVIASNCGNDLSLTSIKSYVANCDISTFGHVPVTLR